MAQLITILKKIYLGTYGKKRKKNVEDHKSTTSPTSAETESNEKYGKPQMTGFRNVVVAKVIDELLLEEPRTSTNHRFPHVSDNPQRKLLPEEQELKDKYLMSKKIKIRKVSQ